MDIEDELAVKEVIKNLLNANKTAFVLENKHNNKADKLIVAGRYAL